MELNELIESATHQIKDVELRISTKKTKTAQVVVCNLVLKNGMKLTTQSEAFYYHKAEYMVEEAKKMALDRAFASLQEMHTYHLLQTKLDEQSKPKILLPH